MSINNEWWGFSPKHGWVVLDRNITTNRPAIPGKLIFLRCKDWTSYEEERKKWEPPLYIFSDQYLESLSENIALETQKILDDLKYEYAHKKEEFYSSVVQERHRQFLNDAGRVAPATRKARKKNRSSNCWNCKQPVDNSIDLECVACGWIICGSCGACGCTYGGIISNHPHEDFPKQPEKETTSQDSVFQSFKEASQYAKENPGLKILRTNDGSGWKVE